MTDRYAALLGARLRRIRMQQRLSLDDVEAASHGRFRASILSAYERGARGVSVSRLAGLARFYGVPVSELLPDDTSIAAEAGPSRAGPPVLDLVRLAAADLEGLEPVVRFARRVQLVRQDHNREILTLRAADVRTLADALGVGVDRLLARLEEGGLLRAPGDPLNRPRTRP